MASFSLLDAASIAYALSETSRQYLVGALQRPQILDHFPDSRLEVGLTVYRASSSEAPHRHTEATEFQYVLDGHTEYLEIDSHTVHAFRTGDFYVIRPGTSYAQRSKAGTRILFIKVPSTDDKESIPASPDLLSWLNSKPSVTRTDYFHSADAPPANSLRPAAAVAIFDEFGRVLLLHRRDNKKWTLPGGTLELGESLAECAIREVEEECGLDVELSGILGTYTDPEVRVEYSDGEVRQEFTVVYAARLVGGTLRLDQESTEYRWLAVHEALELPLADSQRHRLRDVQRYWLTGEQHPG